MLTLAEAIKTDRLPEFVAHEEAVGLSAVNRETFDRVIRAVKPATATVERRVPEMAMVRAVAQLGEVKRQLLAANVDVR